MKQQSEAVDTRAIAVGGGVGVPPLVFLAATLGASQVRVQALIGARTRADVLGESDFAALGVEVGVATDDGSAGHRGRVTDLLQDELKRDGRAVVYACGPWPMLRAVAEVCRLAEVRCQVSLEESMPCGIGVCNGCVVRAKAPFAEAGEGAEPTEVEAVGDEWSLYHRYRRVCVEGPACWAHEIDWESAT